MFLFWHVIRFCANVWDLIHSEEMNIKVSISCKLGFLDHLCLCCKDFPFPTVVIVWIMPLRIAVFVCMFSSLSKCFVISGLCYVIIVRGLYSWNSIFDIYPILTHTHTHTHLQVRLLTLAIDLWKSYILGIRSSCESLLKPSAPSSVLSSITHNASLIRRVLMSPQYQTHNLSVSGPWLSPQTLAYSVKVPFNLTCTDTASFLNLQELDNRFASH